MVLDIVQNSGTVSSGIWESSEESIFSYAQSCHQVEIGIFQLTLVFSLLLSMVLVKAPHQDRLPFATFFKHYFLQ